MAGDLRQAGYGNVAGAEQRSGDGSSAVMGSNSTADGVAEQADRPAAAVTAVDDHTRGTMRGRVIEELVSNSAHYPVANAVLEILLAREAGFQLGIEVFAMLAAAVVQAYVLTRMSRSASPRPFLGNLVGPALFSVVTVVVSGVAVLATPNYLAYWVFSAVIGVLQCIEGRIGTRAREALLLLESIVRASILLATYWAFEIYIDRHYATLSGFLSDNSHIYVTIVIPILGALFGIANIARLRSRALLASMNTRLRTLSEWCWGSNIVCTAISDPTALTPGRQMRTLLFMDIRSFTPWCERRIAAEVTEMLETFYRTCEEVWSRHAFVSARLTADQVLLVFADPDEAIRTALELRSEVEAALSTYGLRAGIGINTGQVVEGLIGGRSKKIYEVVGDSANIASRICQAAKGGEILVSEPLVRRLNNRFALGSPMEISVKGKDTKIRVYAVTGAVRASDRHRTRDRVSGGLGRKRPDASSGAATQET